MLRLSGAFLAIWPQLYKYHNIKHKNRHKPCVLTFIECNDLDIVSAMCDCFMALLITSSLCCVYTASIGLSL